jgi:hypothetical protein
MNNITKGFSPAAMRETLELSDIAWKRFYTGHSNYELGEAVASDEVLQNFSKTASDKNKAAIAIKTSDLAALTAGIEIAKTEYKDAQNGSIAGDSAKWWSGKDVSFKEGSTDWKRAITNRAEWLWQRSQPSWDKWNRSMITSDPSAFRKFFLIFRSFHEKSFTILQTANREYKNSNKTLEDKAKWAKQYGAVLSGYAINTTLRALVMVGLRRELKEPFEYLTDLITSPFTMLPVLGKILQTTIRSFVYTLNNAAPKYYGEALDSMILEVINTMAKAPDNFGRAAAYYINGDSEKAEKALKRSVGQLYEGVGKSVGVPTSEIRNTYKGWFEEEKESTGHTRRTRSR